MEKHEIISAVCLHWETAGEIIPPFQCQWPSVTRFAANVCLWLTLLASLHHTFVKFQGKIVQIIFLMDFTIIFVLSSLRKGTYPSGRRRR